MNDFKTMKFVRETRDKIYKETKNKTSKEVKEYYKEKTNWIKPLLQKNVSKTLKTKSRP
jgi:hypothetical protein